MIKRIVVLILKKNGKKCDNHLLSGQVICNKHHSKNQSGGFLYELIYPLGASVGMATYTLYKVNNIVGDWYMDRHNKKNKKSKKIL